MTGDVSSSGKRSGQSSTIVVADDEILIRMATADTLREHGYRVLEASSAAEALALLNADEDVALVVTDVRMPGEVDGVGLTRRVKQVWPHLPVVIISGHLQPDTAAAADAFLRKPVSTQEIAKIVMELIDRPWPSKQANSKAS